MKVAIPVHGTRVSPLFDTAERLLMVESNDSDEVAREVLPMSGLSVPARVSYLSKLGIDVLICGGISRPVAGMVESSGIRLIPWVAGEVEEVRRAYESGRLGDPRFLMPGCGRRRRGGQRGGRRVSRWYGTDNFNLFGERS